MFIEYKKQTGPIEFQYNIKPKPKKKQFTITEKLLLQLREQRY